MIFLRNALLTAALVLATDLVFSQTYIANTGSLIWDLGPDDPRINVQLGTKGINIGGYEDVAPVVKNNFADTLLVKIEFNLTDYCGTTKTYTTNSKTLAGHERWAPSPFFEGYSFNTECKKFGEYGPAKDKTKTRIYSIRHTIVTLRNLTEERKEARAEKARKERELVLKRQQEEEARRKAAEERKAEEERKLAERKKQEEDRKAEEAKRKAEADRQQAASVTQSQQRDASSANNPGSTTAQGTTQHEPTMQERLARQAEAQRMVEEKRAEERAAAEAAEEEHNRIVYEKKLADLRRQEEERLAERQRQKQLEQKRIEYTQKTRVVQEASEQVGELQMLNLNHSSIEEMEREYAQKLSQLNVAMNNLEQAKQEQWTAAVQSTDWGKSATEQSVGELMEVTGAFVNSLGEEKRKREARETLAYQRRQFLQRIEDEKAQMRYNMRVEMLENFAPWTPQPTNGPTRIYGFYILHNYPGLASETSSLTISNIAEIGTYADGTWPTPLYFHMLEGHAANGFSSRRFHSNSYGTRAEAEQMRQTLIQLFSKHGTVSEIHIDGNINTPGQRMDFWETGIISEE